NLLRRLFFDDDCALLGCGWGGKDKEGCGSGMGRVGKE
ncbi:hypothetical protein A2U01_0115818, partial [Trifolium medium]|nr:hypothetical protein [Trifolium medium]